MQCYLITFRDADTPTEKLEGAFSQLFRFSAKTWAVGSETPTTCSDIVDTLTEGKDPGWTCIVVKLDTYNGYAENAPWEKIAPWESM